MGKELLQGYYNNEETGGISTFSVVTDDGYPNKSVCKNIEEVGDNVQKDRTYLDDDLYETISDESIAWEIQKERDEGEIAREIDRVRSGNKVSEKVNRAHLMTGYSKNRIKNDIYNTPKYIIPLLLKKVNFNNNILEPMCSKGNISQELEQYYGFSKIIKSSDIRTDDDIYGIKGVDFLKIQLEDLQGIKYDIFSNPPYDKENLIPIIKHCKEIAYEKIVLLLKLDALGGKARFEEIWMDKKFPLKEIFVFVKRLDFEQKNAPTLCHAFYVWDKNYKGEPMLKWLNNYNL